MNDRNLYKQTKLYNMCLAAGCNGPNTSLSSVRYIIHPKLIINPCYHV